jgi:hypothetical protein
MATLVVLEADFQGNVKKYTVEADETKGQYRLQKDNNPTFITRIHKSVMEPDGVYASNGFRYFIGLDEKKVFDAFVKHQQRTIKRLQDELQKAGAYIGAAQKTFSMEAVPKKQTNSEWVRGLSDEQLVKLFRTFKEDNCSMCADHYKRGSEDEDEDCGFCYEEQVRWMSMEHDDDSFEERDFHFCV